MEVRASLASVEKQLLGALKTLDAINAPADIGAHIDLALHRLRDFDDGADVLKLTPQMGSSVDILSK